MPLGDFPWFDPRSLTSLVFPGSPEGGRIPPGGYPSPRRSSFARGFWRHRLVFLFIGQGANPGKGCDEVRFTLIADVPFSRLSASPFSSSFTSRQGLSAVASLFCIGALRMDFPKIPFQESLSFHPTPFSGLPAGGLIP